jgi:hypothetical protein
MEAPIRSLDIELQVFEARTPSEFESAVLVMAGFREIVDAGGQG